MVLHRRRIIPLVTVSVGVLGGNGMQVAQFQEDQSPSIHHLSLGYTDTTTAVVVVVVVLSVDGGMGTMIVVVVVLDTYAIDVDGAHEIDGSIETPHRR